MNESIGHHFQAWPIKQLHIFFHFLFSFLLLNGQNSDALEVNENIRRKEPESPSDNRESCHQPRTCDIGLNKSQKILLYDGSLRFGASPCCSREQCFTNRLFMIPNNFLIYYIIKSFTNAIRVDGSLRSERCEESLRIKISAWCTAAWPICTFIKFMGVVFPPVTSGCWNRWSLSFLLILNLCLFRCLKMCVDVFRN